MKRITTLLLGMALLAASLQACHTVRGAGEDVQQGGRAIEKSTE
ncbi:MAG: entericidin A/B family lipoprotein [Desulfobacteraceae bacterium]|nr:entericidin A/B family lipoprotein [Desulfobacteraceae bacterium]